MPGGGTDEAGNVYLTSCDCDFGRDYDPATQSNGALWRIVQADKVGEGAVTASPEPEGSPAASESPAAEPSETPEATETAEATETPEATEPSETEAPTETAAPEDTPEATETAAATSGAEGDTITMVDVAFEPDSLTIAADTDVEISLPNTGASVHDFVIDELDISEEVAPGDTGSVTINAPAGTYTFYCKVPGHRQAGMEGTLTVK